MDTRTHRRRGVTLAEVSICTLLTGMVAVGALRSVGAVWQTWAVAADRGDGTALAHQLLDEIVPKSYQDPDGSPVWKTEAGEATSDRLDFDDTDDYDDWTASPPQHADGTPIDGFGGWTRAVIVQKLNGGYVPQPDTATDIGLREITVTVTDPGGRTYTAAAYRSSVAGTLQPQGVDMTVVTWVGCTMQVGAGGQEVVTGTTVSNHAEDR